MKPQCNTSADCLRELARVMDQFGFSDSLEAANSKYVKYFGKYMRREKLEIPFFSSPEEWQFALAEIEGRPVFIGDELYYFDRKIHAVKVLSNVCIGADDGMNYSVSALTWNPPKPATVMVELTVEDASYISRGMWPNDTAELACKTALEKLKS